MELKSKSAFLIIQTAFIGDVILATALIEKLAKSYPQGSIDFLVRQGNESLLKNNPHVREVLIWNKKKDKIRNLLKLILSIRKKRYDVVINVHRYSSSGLITTLSKAKMKIGFAKNPLSLFFTHRFEHSWNSNLHEVERNQKLIEAITDSRHSLPRLYPSQQDYIKIREYQVGSYVCIAPNSVWYTKQWLFEKWIEFIIDVANQVDKIYLLGAPSDRDVCDHIKSKSGINRVVNLAGALSFLESAALMKHARMNYVNDSAPMHIASSMNAPVTAVYCSTVPSFGFGPLSDRSYVIETKEKLTCRPCGLHGHKACPQKHFKCAETIAVQQLIDCM